MIDRGYIGRFLKSVFICTCFMLLGICIFVIFIYGTVHWDCEGILCNTWTPKHKVIVLVSGIIALLGIGGLFNTLVNEQRSSVRKNIFMILIFLAVSIQFFLVFKYQVQMGWDNTVTLNSAISIVTGDKSLFSHYYFEIYQNQRCFLIVTALLVWISHSLGIPFSDMPLILSLVSVICVDLSMYCSYCIVKALRGRKAANKIIFWMLMNPGLYLWCSYYYTTNVSLLFLTLAVLMFIKIWTAEKKWYYYVLFGMFLLFGIQYRATLIIVVIGAIILGIIRKPPNVLKSMLLLAVGIFVMQLIFVGLCIIFVPGKKGDQAFPVAHWLMMGAQGVGAYNDQDVSYTASFQTKEERSKADMELYFERLKELRAEGCLKLAVRKMTYNWAYGNHDYKPEFQQYDSLYDYLWGTKNDRLLIYEQVYYVTILLLILFGIVIYLKEYTNAITDLMFIPLITLLGGILFYILWETNPYYSVGFMTIMLLCATDGIVKLDADLNWKTEGSCKTKKSIRRSWLFYGVVLLTGFLHIFLLSDVEFCTSLRTPVITQSKVSGTLFFDGENIIKQDFVANRSFNTIELWLTKTRHKEDSTGVYRITLSGENEEIIFQDTIYNQDVFRTIDYIKNFDTVVIKGMGKYTLSIETIVDDPKNRLGICYYNFPVDAYRRGELYMDGEKLQGDLMINVFMTGEGEE